MAHYSPADAEVRKLIGEVMTAYHGDLVSYGVTVDALMAYAPVGDDGVKKGPALKKNGYPAAAMIRATSLKQRVLGLCDAELTIDGDRWEEWTDEGRASLIDHELTHLELKRDAEGEVMIDDHERPKLRMRPHDHEVGLFEAVYRRHGEKGLEFLAFDSMRSALSQLHFDFMGS